MNLKESGFSAVARILSGMRETVPSFGIITAENPNSQKASPSYNRSKQDQLARDLHSYGWTKLRGSKFEGNIENPFFIPKIGLDELLALGARYNQSSVIYGTVNDGKIEYKFIDVKSGKVLDSQSEWAQLDKNTADNYSQVKGRKFAIPFFSESELEFWVKNALTLTQADALLESPFEPVYEEVTKDDEDRIEAIVRRVLKNDDIAEDTIVKIVKNVLTQLFKSFYTKRSVWKSDLRNVAESDGRDDLKGLPLPGIAKKYARMKGAKWLGPKKVELFQKVQAKLMNPDKKTREFKNYDYGVTDRGGH